MTNPFFIGLLLLAPLLLLAAILWQRSLIALIPLAVGLNGLPIIVGATNVRMEQIVALSATIALGASVLLGQRRLFLDRTAKWLCVVALLHLLSSVLFSPARSYSVQQTASLMAVWALYIVIINYVDNERRLRTFFRVVVAAGIAYTTIGIFAFLLGIAGFGIGGANIDPLSNAPYGTFGTMYEPNIFGSYCAGYSTLALAAIVLGTAGRKQSEGWAWPLLLTAGTGLLLSFTRGAWLGAFAAAFVVLLLAHRFYGARIRLRRLIIPLVVIAALAVAFWFLPFEGAEFFRYKVRNFVNLQSENAIVRLLTYALALEQYVQRPLLGWGTFTFAPLTVEGLPFKEFEGWHALWIGNFALQVLHDTGMIGLLAFTAMLWSLITGAYRSTQRILDADPELACRVLTSLAAVVALLVAFLFTTGFTMGYSWMFVGLLGAFTRIAIQKPATQSAPTPAVKAA